MNEVKKIVKKDETTTDHHAEDDHHDDSMLMGGHHKKAEEGEGPWLVSYADMMTLLMGFFALIASFSKPNAKEFDKVAAAASQYFGGEYQAPYEKLGQKIVKIVKENKLDDNVHVEVGVDGVTMTFTGTLFFDSGDFLVKDEAVVLLNKLLSAVNKESVELNALIEGHTDDVPIRHPIVASNWELSAIRAARIAQYFEKNGFQKNQLIIMGWGETKPVASNKKTDGSPDLEGRSKNRRVVIRLYKEFESRAKDQISDKSAEQK